MAKYFTNPRVILDQVNAGAITSKDPREFEINNQTAQERLEEFREELEKTKRNNQVPDYLYRQGKELYQIIKGEFKLKEKARKWFEELTDKEKIEFQGIIADRTKYKTNIQLEVKYLPGGNLAIMKGFFHYPSNWINNFSELGKIYKNARWVAIEGYVNNPIGESLQEHWQSFLVKDYNILMRQLVKNGFRGEFIELDSRNVSKIDLDILNVLFPFTSKKIHLSLYKYLKKINPELIKKIGNQNDLQKLLNLQTMSSLKFREEIEEKLENITTGTYQHSRASVRGQNGKFETTTLPEGLEIGPIVFTDALSVIKIFLMNKMMNEGKIDRGLLVDFQGGGHLYYKSFFFEHPEYAFEVVLRTLAEVMAGEIKIDNQDFDANKQAMVELLNNLLEKVWRKFIESIGTIPKTKVKDPGIIRRSVEPISFFQRKMTNPEYLIYHQVFSDNQEMQKYKEKFIKTMTELFQR